MEQANLQQIQAQLGQLILIFYKNTGLFISLYKGCIKMMFSFMKYVKAIHFSYSSQLKSLTGTQNIQVISQNKLRASTLTGFNKYY